MRKIIFEEEGFVAYQEDDGSFTVEDLAANIIQSQLKSREEAQETIDNNRSKGR
ncbi:hypothetical protein [Thiohalorhabdus methylotrophus]|uniref:Uncharacterized protein n=1 Tax=Thiohalorhabdus methylotrophus TaxID=3242694 RepID=A0ABV4TYG3_9GAMM